eukprot:3300674-Lingulodinium_polyedra.AAC.1
MFLDGTGGDCAATLVPESRPCLARPAATGDVRAHKGASARAPADQARGRLNCIRCNNSIGSLHQ